MVPSSAGHAAPLARQELPRPCSSTQRYTTTNVSFFVEIEIFKKNIKEEKNIFQAARQPGRMQLLILATATAYQTACQLQS
jgi:hypothetical protein